MKQSLALLEDFLTGAEEMDHQHQMLVDLLNDTYALLGEGRRQEAINKVLTGVVQYTDYHFRQEESFLDSVSYPELEAHRKIHESFRSQVLQWVEEAKTGNDRALHENSRHVLGVVLPPHRYQGQTLRGLLPWLGSGR
ncbi:MAG: hemerythrin domain-containing protein [Thermoanaerobaculum sp.]|nr:hemerythrin domain-containing protein [Thermoanaerobaculum sp.]MDW7968772.1 hemerythrin domain-containing protein [Thermoanaerobaculum sp.]